MFGIDTSNLWTPLFWLVMIASIPAVIWFFRVRKLMIKRQVTLLSMLERGFRPKDTRYTVHGYLVGFTAKYWVYHGPVTRAWIYYSSPPHHVFFYLPFIYLLGKKERLDITLELKRMRVKGKAHVYRPGDRHVERTLEIDLAKEKRERYMETRIVLPRQTAKALYTNGEALDWARRIYTELSRLTDVRRVSVDPGRRGLHVSTIPRLSTLEEVLSRLEEYAREMMGKESGDIDAGGSVS